MDQQMNTDVSDFWKSVWNKTKRGDIHVEGGEQIANLFASHFSFVYYNFEKITFI